MSDDMQLFVDPKATDTLELFGGKHWIRVKRDLSARDTKEIQQAGHMQFITTQGEAAKAAEDKDNPNREVRMGLNIGNMKLVRAYKYLLAWSFTLNGQDVALTPSAIDTLVPNVFDAIDEALDAHEKRIAEAKKTRTGAPTSDAA